MSKKIWLPEEIKALIEIYESHEILWNIKCTAYRDREKKQKVLEEIGVKFSCSAGEVQRKLHNLRNQVSQEMKKIKNRKSGSGIDEIYLSNWPYFNALKFVIPGLIATSTQFNLLETSSNAEVKKEINIIIKKPSQNDEIHTSTSSKRKREGEEDMALKAAIQVLAKQVPDEYDKFGESVANELRSLRSDCIRRKLKNEIRKAIVRAVDEDI